jgi:hypothetical protein
MGRSDVSALLNFLIFGTYLEILTAFGNVVVDAHQMQSIEFVFFFLAVLDITRALFQAPRSLSMFVMYFSMFIQITLKSVVPVKICIFLNTSFVRKVLRLI